jgi:hypothetical protein
MILLSSALAILGGTIVLTLVKDCPFIATQARFNPRIVISCLTQRGIRLAHFGYLGHMWELYAMWTWVPIFLVETLKSRSGSSELASIIAFGVIAIGGTGSIVAGVLADRLGRTVITSGAMVSRCAS